MARSRLTRDDWISAARKAFIASSIENVKVDELARRLKVTRGSFYSHFKHRRALLEALLEDWEANYRLAIASVKKRVARGEDGLVEIFNLWLTQDRGFPAFDIAIRAWARKSDEVATLVRAIDEAWISLFQSVLEGKGVSGIEAFVRARIMYFHQIGYYSLSMAQSQAERIERAPHYYTALTGLPVPEVLLELLRSSAKRLPVVRTESSA